MIQFPRNLNGKDLNYVFSKDATMVNLCLEDT